MSVKQTFNPMSLQAKSPTLSATWVEDEETPCELGSMLVWLSHASMDAQGTVHRRECRALRDRPGATLDASNGGRIIRHRKRGNLGLRLTKDHRNHDSSSALVVQSWYRVTRHGHILFSGRRYCGRYEPTCCRLSLVPRHAMNQKWLRCNAASTFQGPAMLLLPYRAEYAARSPNYVRYHPIAPKPRLCP